MTDIEVNSWIFLAVALATNTEPTDINGISKVADGINHLVPTQKELQTAISWLSKNELILKQDKKYQLTLKGKQEYEIASNNVETAMKIWSNIELRFNQF